MIDELRPYPEMKPSGLPWLGDVPSHWDVRRIKTLLKEVDNRTKTGEERLLSLRMRQGLVDHIDAGGKLIPPESLVNFRIVEPGQVVMNRMRAAAGLFGVASVRGLVSPDYAVFEPKPEAFNPYLLQAFRLPSLSAVFRAESKGLGTGESGFLRLYTDRFGPIPVPYPPLDEQRLIVRFLDWHGAQTAKLIRAKKKIIALLSEQKQAIIYGAVSRGLDTKVKLKSSGVPWLGDVPEDWEVKRIKDLARLRSGEGITAFEIDERGDYPVYGGNGLRGFTSRFTHDGEYVLIGRQGALCGNINYASGRFFASEHAVVANPREKFDVRWFGELLRTMNLNQYSISAAQPGLSVERITALQIPVPSLAEQERIVAAFDAQTHGLGRVIGVVERDITFVQEFRVRLISDVVTGKLDVRALAATLPELVEGQSIEGTIDDEEFNEATDDVEDEEVAA
jgi:type I restriction enzyme S subunit